LTDLGNTPNQVGDDPGGTGPLLVRINNSGMVEAVTQLWRSISFSDPHYLNITAAATTFESQTVRIKQEGMAKMAPRSESLMIRVNALLRTRIVRQSIMK
jgi:hypothetical protein